MIDVYYLVSNAHKYTCNYIYCFVCAYILLVVLSPNQVNELRNQGDEIAREMAMLGGDRENTSQERRGFEEFMKLVSS